MNIVKLEILNVLWAHCDLKCSADKHQKELFVSSFFNVLSGFVVTACTVSEFHPAIRFDLHIVHTFPWFPVLHVP